jgi:hypothetical protein
MDLPPSDRPTTIMANGYGCCGTDDLRFLSSLLHFSVPLPSCDIERICMITRKEEGKYGIVE